MEQKDKCYNQETLKNYTVRHLDIIRSKWNLKKTRKRRDYIIKQIYNHSLNQDRSNYINPKKHDISKVDFNPTPAKKQKTKATGSNRKKRKVNTIKISSETPERKRLKCNPARKTTKNGSKQKKTNVEKKMAIANRIKQKRQKTNERSKRFRFKMTKQQKMIRSQTEVARYHKNKREAAEFICMECGKICRSQKSLNGLSNMS